MSRGVQERVYPQQSHLQDEEREEENDHKLPKDNNEITNGKNRMKRRNADEERQYQEYHQRVIDWANASTPPHASFWRPLDLFSPHYAKLKMKARFCENIASHVKGFRIDGNHDGQLTESEVKEREEEAKVTVEGYLNLLVNFGVVGALFISVLFGSAVGDLSLSDESIRFFGLKGAKVLKYLFLAFVYGAAFLSLHLIHRSVTLYKHLSFWMPDQVSQMEWVQTVSITSTVVISQLILFLVMVAIPCGAAAAISPIAYLFLMGRCHPHLHQRHPLHRRAVGTPPPKKYSAYSD